MRLELPQYHTADENLRQVYAYLTRLVDKLNYVLTVIDVPDESGDAAIRAEDPTNKTIKLGENSTNTQYPSAKAVVDYAVPQTRTVNEKSLKDDVVLTAADVGAVPTEREINGHALTGDVELEPADLGEADHVTESGETDGWRWRVWASGLKECWCAEEVSIASGGLSAWGSVYAKTFTKSYPADFFSGVPMLSATPSGGTTGGWIGLAHPSQNTAAQAAFTVMRAANTTAATTVRVSLYAREAA